MWIHEQKDWPHFKWDIPRLTSILVGVRHSQGRLIGQMERLGFDLRQEATLKTLISDVLTTSAIEGEILNVQEVRSSIARRLGLSLKDSIPVGRDVEGIVEIMLDATQNFSIPLTQDRLFDWHAALFPAGRSGLNRITVGGWRTAAAGPMQVVSGPVGREKIHFEAPVADRIPNEMSRFLKWFEHHDDVDPVIKAGIAHLWFVTIHPFEDGNGRIGRAIADMALARAEGISDRFYSLSKQIETERKSYYHYLEKQQRGTTNITDWLEWFLKCLGSSIASAQTSIGRVLFKANLWAYISEHSINERQRQIINRMLEDDFIGFMNTSKYAKLAKCSNDTALRDIQDLKMLGIFIQNKDGGRSTSYRLLSEGQLL